MHFLILSSHSFLYTHTSIHTYIHTYIQLYLLAFESVSSVATVDLPGQGAGQGVWIELFDPEDREELKFGDRVICLRHTGKDIP